MQGTGAEDNTNCQCTTSQDLSNSISDPRVNPQYLRVIPGGSSVGKVILIGVVHDHPSSIGRVRSIISTVVPDIIGIEASPITVPYYRVLASNETTESQQGGEISAAIQGAPGLDIRGIDLPSYKTTYLLARYLLNESLSIPTVKRLVQKIVSVTKQAMIFRIVAILMGYTSLSYGGDLSTTYDCDTDASPYKQARHEALAVSQSARFFDLVEVPPALEAYDKLREMHMARKIDQLRTDRNRVVAIVGLDHLDELAVQLISTT